ncbi:MAG: Mrp/NBP35 family ATP-binding protein [Acidimicrobiaceae bacterium]|nr:Mrp/NBP35 family ATP-binding protein [Acidimicrobiaceae bacterium]
MAVTKDEVSEALRGVLEPEIRKPLVELGLIGEPINAWGGKLVVPIGVIADPLPYEDALKSAVLAALAKANLASKNDVELRGLSDKELVKLRNLLRPASDSDSQTVANPIGHEQGRSNQFMQPGSKTRVLGVSSGKGGVGKSSTTVNLAIALAKKGYEVGILDADVYGFSVPKMLGITRNPLLVDDLMLPPVAYGVRCISVGFFVSDETPVIWRGPMLHKALEQFLVDVYWGDLDFLLLDMPPGTGDVALSMGQYLPKSEILVVTTPQPAAQRVAQRSAYAARQLKLPLRGVIENMSWFVGDDGKKYMLFGEGGGKVLADDLGVPLLAQIPLVPEIRAGGDDGVPIMASEPESEVSKAYDTLATAVESMGPARVYRSELKVKS